MRILDRLVSSALLALVFTVSLHASAATDARADIFQAYKKMMDSRFAIDITSTSSHGTMKTRCEYDTVDRIHLWNPHTEVIVTPEGTWMRVNGNWTRSPVDMGGMVRQFIPKSVDDLRGAMTDAKDEGITTWNGKPARKYAYSIDTTTMGIHVTSTNTIFVDGAGRIVHAESDGEAMGQKSHTVQDVRYDDSIRVKAPV